MKQFIKDVIEGWLGYLFILMGIGFCLAFIIALLVNISHTLIKSY